MNDSGSRLKQLEERAKASVEAGRLKPMDAARLLLEWIDTPDDEAEAIWQQLQRIEPDREPRKICEMEWLIEFGIDPRKESSG
jgi:hypothetical protein